MEIRYFEFTEVEEPETLALSAAVLPEPEAPDAAVRIWLNFTPGDQDAADETCPYVFVMAQPNLGLQMERTVRGIYVLYRSKGLDQLLAAFSRPDTMWTADGIQLSKDSDYAAILREEFVNQRKALERRLTEAAAAIARTAAAIALKSVEQAQRTAESERKRYLGVGGSLVGRTHAQELNGPDVVALAKALVKLAPLRRELKVASLRMSVTESTDTLRRANEAQINAILRAGRLPRYARDMGIDPVQAARDELRQKQTAFLIAVEAASTVFPLICRLCNDDSIADVIEEARRQRRSEEEQASDLRYSAALRNLVVDQLKAIRQASVAVRSRIVKDKDKGKDKNNDEGTRAFDVWQYPPLINKAMALLGVPDATVEGQAAADLMAKAEVSWISRFSLACGIFEMGAAIAGAAPPLLLAAGLVSLVFGAADWFRETWKSEEERDVFNSSVNPAESFAAEPSAIWPIIGLAFLVLQIRGVSRVVP
jgi:hypothetical protein